jgi:hypothetical protein
MSADKLQAVHDAFADPFEESNSNASGTATTLDHETLSEAFSEPRPNAVNEDPSFARFDHAALTGILGESRNERPSSTSFDQAFSEALSERSPLSSNTQSQRPGFDHQAFAELLSGPPPISTNKNVSQPSFDHQALA